MENKKYSYPQPYDISEVLSNMSSSIFQKRFAQSKGIFMPNGSKKTIGENLSLFFWDDDDINEIQNEAYLKKNTYALSGFSIDTDFEFDLADVLTSLISKGELDKYTIDSPRRISDKNQSSVYKSRVEYTKKKIAKLQFLQEESVEFDFYIKQVGKKSWNIEIDSKSSKDMSIVKNIYRKHVDLKNNITEMEIDDLSSKNTVNFLDQLRQKGLSSDWEFRDIKQLTLKRSKMRDLEDDNTNEDEETLEASEEEISGITQAILDGHHLREHPFVMKSEDDGYIFTSMTYLFYHKKDPLAIQIKADFKGKPKVFEISITKAATIEGPTGNLNDIQLAKEKDLEIRTEFWNNALAIFKTMKNK